VFLCLSLQPAGWAVANKVDNANFAVDTYYPTLNEIHVAQQRVTRYLQNHSQGSTDLTRYIAVYTTSAFLGSIVQDIYPKLINSGTTVSFFLHGEDHKTDFSIIMIYDTVANRFVSNSGYVSVDLPPRGSLARWDVYIARYIGRG
jgi:hypothetical protein